MDRAWWIHLFLFLHVLGAIVAVGPTLTYALWLRLGERAGPSERSFVLRGVIWVDGHLATPGFMAQAATGVALILLLRISFLHTAWLLTGVVVYVVTAGFAISVYAPVIRRQVSLAERVAASPHDPAVGREYAAVAARARTLGIAAMVLTLAIVFFMVAKPVLWSAG